MTRTTIVSKRQPFVQYQLTFDNTPLDTGKSYTYLGYLISNNGSFKLNINQLCKSASRALYNLSDNVNKNLSGNSFILTEVFYKMILPVCTCNCKYVVLILFPRNFSPADFLSEKQCKNPLDKLDSSFLKHILCVKSST